MYSCTIHVWLMGGSRGLLDKSVLYSQTMCPTYSDTVRHRVHSETFISASIKQQFRRKGRSGQHSYNVGVASERLLDIDYAAFDAFTVALDILASSGVAVDIVVDDFRAWYPQRPMANTEHHLNSQIICSAGLEVNPRPNFGSAVSITILKYGIVRVRFAAKI